MSCGRHKEVRYEDVIIRVSCMRNKINWSSLPNYNAIWQRNRRLGHEKTMLWWQMEPAAENDEQRSGWIALDDVTAPRSYNYRSLPILLLCNLSPELSWCTVPDIQTWQLLWTFLYDSRNDWKWCKSSWRWCSCHPDWSRAIVLTKM